MIQKPSATAGTLLTVSSETLIIRSSFAVKGERGGTAARMSDDDEGPRGWYEAVVPQGNEILTRSPGRMASRFNLAPWSSATALTRLRPRPLPGVVRLRSPR